MKKNSLKWVFLTLGFKLSRLRIYIIFCQVKKKKERYVVPCFFFILLLSILLTFSYFRTARLFKNVIAISHLVISSVMNTDQRLSTFILFLHFPHPLLIYSINYVLQVIWIDLAHFGFENLLRRLNGCLVEGRAEQNV